MNKSLPSGLVITGPTCSGKSALALALAKKADGVVINADSMQVYSNLRILTARPTVEEENEVSHQLYGVLDSSHGQGNAAWWVDQAMQVLDQCHKTKKIPIITGGTGMYLKSLFEGLSPVPAISEDIREKVRALGKDEGPAAVKDRLMEVDPESAERIEDADLVRLCRALEVWEETKKTLTWWRQQTRKPDTGFHFLWVHLDPPKLLLNNCVRDRLNHMAKIGAIEEVKELQKLDLTDDHPIMRAHGVPELINYIKGNMSLKDALDKASGNIARYTKRQRTWFKHHSLGDSVPRLDIAYRATNFPDNKEGELEVAKILETVYSFCEQNSLRI